VSAAIAARLAAAMLRPSSIGKATFCAFIAPPCHRCIAAKQFGIEA
jgi:hypothetical protein